MTPGHARPLLVTADAQLAAAVTDVAAEAGQAVRVRAGLDCLGQTGRAAPLLLIGADVPPPAGSWHQPPRAEVVVVALHEEAGAWQLARQLSAVQVIVLEQGSSALMERLRPAARSQGSVLAVASASGGVGASTLALSVALWKRDTWVADLDVAGGGLGVLLGADVPVELSWTEVVGTDGPLHPQAMDEALPRFGGMRVLTSRPGPVPTVPQDRVAAVIDAARQAAAYTVVDCPRGPVARFAAGTADQVVLLVRPTARGILAGAASLAQLRADGAQVGVVCAELGRSKGVPSGAVSEYLGVPVSSWPRLPGVDAAADHADLVHALRRRRARTATERILRDLPVGGWVS